jgi:hypothetical protein
MCHNLIKCHLKEARKMLQEMADDQGTPKEHTTGKESTPAGENRVCLNLQHALRELNGSAAWDWELNASRS